MKRLILQFLLFFSVIDLFSGETIKLTFAGDLMSHDVNYKTAPLSAIYSDVKEIIQSDDLSFINMEFPIDEDRPQTSYPAFNVHPSYLEAAISSGFDVFSAANNHTNDFGLKSLLKTIENLNLFRDQYGIRYSGLFQGDETEYKVESIEIKGLKVGFLAITQFSNNTWSEQGAKKVYTASYGEPEEVNKLKKFISIESQKYDCFILSYHGGGEYWEGPSKLRKSFFKSMIDSGVDILWGHHPHVLQPWELIESDSGDKLIIYSMGNFISGQLAIVDPVENDINFAATGFSALFQVDISMEEDRLNISSPNIEMIANIRNEDNYFIAVKKDIALNHPMSEDWKSFYKKMFDVAEYRIREIKID